MSGILQRCQLGSREGIVLRVFLQLCEGQPGVKLESDKAQALRFVLELLQLRPRQLRLASRQLQACRRQIEPKAIEAVLTL